MWRTLPGLDTMDVILHHPPSWVRSGLGAVVGAGNGLRAQEVSSGGKGVKACCWGGGRPGEGLPRGSAGPLTKAGATHLPQN